MESLSFGLLIDMFCLDRAVFRHCHFISGIGYFFDSFESLILEAGRHTNMICIYFHSIVVWIENYFICNESLNTDHESKSISRSTDQFGYWLRALNTLVFIKKIVMFSMMAQNVTFRFSVFQNMVLVVCPKISSTFKIIR